MQLTGKQCSVTNGRAMEALAADTPFEKSPKGQIRRPTRPEHVIAFEFLKIHYEEDVKAEIPVQKSDVYTDYEQHCKNHNYKPLVAADFGRILKSMFPNARDRRLGSRGSSKYCYVGVRRKSENNTQKSIMSPYSAEELSKAYQSLVCEWASTVLCRKMQSLGELAKYLLRNRYVQTRSCAALTITASLKDTDELADNQPVNKHRETQLKLQEKLREKLLSKQQGSSHSSSSTPDPDSSQRPVPMQTCSAPGSRRSSPDSMAISVNSSACTSPVFNEGIVVQKPLYPISNHRNSFDGSLLTESRGSLVSRLTAISSQSNPMERSTSVTSQYNGSTQLAQPMNGQMRYQPYDPRIIQSCPNTPLIDYTRGFEFPQQMMSSNTPASTPTQCLSHPNTARNTPVIPDYQDDSYYSPRPFNSHYQSSTHLQQGFPKEVSEFQRVEFGHNDNSAFMPIKDAGTMSHGGYTDSIGQPYASNNELSAHNDSEDLEEISELFNIIDQGNTSAENGNVSTSSMTTVEKSRPLSAQTTLSLPAQHFPHSQSNVSSNSGSVIYELLKSGPNRSLSSGINQRFRHHSGPPQGRTPSGKFSHVSSPATILPMSTVSSIDLNSPPSTPNGNFRPVHTPSRELQTHQHAQGVTDAPLQQPHMSYTGAPVVPARFNGSLVGTMSPPAQPLSKRKRNHSGENVASGLVCNQMSKSGGAANSKSGAAATHDVLDYIARRNLGTQLTSPKIPEEGSQANKS
ncbi:rfx7 [Bugula neritina]|uniref:Rfx7 n=1 Tax=Bugula neritina TaxID=10212 RepID=A0A7J7ISD1_BUGNE|nr:rfx7 [Bugula neritina]